MVRVLFILYTFFCIFSYDGCQITEPLTPVVCGEHMTTRKCNYKRVCYYIVWYPCECEIPHGGGV